ncbi:hypothetical protein ABUE31_00210 [Mesorhizobium sp. ZMM04-5]|uniref:Outer membrane lipoprotein n=1 Tax=Mesorhizobium marinum TaxID=3228790 RepID=A0ABV3QTL8_9HYPH
MTIARKLVSASALAGLSVILAGCLGGGGGGGSSRPVQSGVEGTWIDAQGTGLSTISGGIFTTVATDTGQKLAEGSYALTGTTSVRITGTSLIRQAPISFNCLLVSTSQLNCTSSAGTQFVLTRRA